MPTIKVKSIAFSGPPFRKLADMTIPFAERITLIAGHNGIGKSTILGITSHCAGLTERAGGTNISYFGRLFQANLTEIIHIDWQREYIEPVAREQDLPMPRVEFDIDGEVLAKRCTLTPRTERQEARVVPRSDPLKPFYSKDGSVWVGTAAKVPLPTLYLGMTRMLPVGESEPETITSIEDKKFPAEDAKFIRDFTNSVLLGVLDTNLDDPTITTQSITGTKKTAKHTAYGYSSRCISLGQDSLSAIATALASFKKLQREWPDYPGGLLVIDELDAGFHPHAQKRLANALKTAARQLKLQVVATTHSLSLIEAVHPEANLVGASGKNVDLVHYITEPAQPRLAENFSLENIRDDMNVSLPKSASEKPELKVYFEDEEAAYVFGVAVPLKKKRELNKKYGIRLSPFALSVGGDNLVKISKHEPYFQSTVIAVDADTPIRGKPPNVIKLPGDGNASTKGKSPERTLHAFLTSLVTDRTKHPSSWAELAVKNVTSAYLHEHLLDNPNAGDGRSERKAWWKAKLPLIQQWKLYELWLTENPQKLVEFHAALEEAIQAAIKSKANSFAS